MVLFGHRLSPLPFRVDKLKPFKDNGAALRSLARPRGESELCKLTSADRLHRGRRHRMTHFNLQPVSI